MISKEQFEVMTAFEKTAHISPKEICGAKKISKDDISKIIKELTDLGYINNSEITPKGREVLEPFRVKRAIFIAAGMGSRMMPITLSCPKPLVRVNGIRIIDTLIDACIKAEIEDIIIVRGYLGDCFNQLTDKYPNIKFIDNPQYEIYNNISSAYLVKDLIRQAYVFESDIYLANEALITKYQYKSNYCGVLCDKTPDWCFETDSNLKITDLHKGGKNVHHMYGIAYYDEQTGELFEKYVGEVFDNILGGKDCFWDDVLCHYFVDKSDIYIRECTFRDVIEIDSFEELCEIDERYGVIS